MDGQISLSLRPHSELCIRQFKAAIAIPELAHDDWLEDRLADFMWWNHGLSVLKTGHTSLDYRVRHRPDVHKVIATVLQGLSKVLERCLQIFADEQNTQTTRPPESIRLSNNRLEVNITSSTTDRLGSPITRPPTDLSLSSEGGSISPWSELSDEESDVDDKGLRTETSIHPYSEQKFYIEMYLGLLTTISMSIRKAGTNIRYREADAFLQLHPSIPEYNALREHLAFILMVFAQQRLSEGTPAVPTDGTCRIDVSRLTPIQGRLIEANILRRNRITYCMGASAVSSLNAVGTILPESLPEGPKLEPQPVSTHEPVDYDFPDQAAQIANEARSVAAKLDRSIAGSSRSATHMGSDFVLSLPQIKRAKSTFTRITHTGATLDYPQPPLGRGNFQCLYCVQVLSADYRSESRWRGHVAQDLNPYSCIYVDCPSPLELYASKDEWVKHIKSHHSATQWVCNECTFHLDADEEQYWDDETEWQEHITTHHKHILESTQLPLLSKLSQQSIVKMVSCPLCTTTDEPSGLCRPDMDEHIAEHLHDWALRALPWASGFHDDANDSNAPAESQDAANLLSYENDHSDWDSASDNEEDDVKILLKNEITICANLSESLEVLSKEIPVVTPMLLSRPQVSISDFAQVVFGVCFLWIDQPHGRKELKTVLQKVKRARQILFQISDDPQILHDSGPSQQVELIDTLVFELTYLGQTLGVSSSSQISHENRTDQEATGGFLVGDDQREEDVMSTEITTSSSESPPPMLLKLPTVEAHPFLDSLRDPIPSSNPHEVGSYTNSLAEDDTSEVRRPESPIFQERAEDDMALRRHPTQNVDYLSYDWKEEQIWSSWRYIVSNRSYYSNDSRLENASWRSWVQIKYELKRVSPETLNWLKDCDVTWLYGPLITPHAALFPDKEERDDSPSSKDDSPSSKDDSFPPQKPILKRKSMSDIVTKTILPNELDYLDFPLQTKGQAETGPVPINAPSGNVPPSSARKHIHFDEQVKQSIAVNIYGEEEDGYIHHDNYNDSDSDGGAIMMKGKKKTPLRPQPKSRHSFSGGNKTIATLPSTALKQESSVNAISHETISPPLKPRPQVASGRLLTGDDEGEEVDDQEEGIIDRVIDTVKHARDIVHVIWNEGWRK